jgi:hypothetical protein
MKRDIRGYRLIGWFRTFGEASDEAAKQRSKGSKKFTFHTERSNLGGGYTVYRTTK